jgi:hypothetical protein
MTRRSSGKLGRKLYVIVGRDGVVVFFGLARWEAHYMMKENNGGGRGWRVIVFEAKP